MDKFSCSRCGHTSPFKYNIKTHINKQFKCGEGPVEIIENKEVEIKCEHCNKNFASIQHLKRHLVICKIKKTNLEKELVIKNTENKLLKEQLNEANKKLSHITTTTNNIQTQNVLNITLTNYNEPNLEGMEKYFLGALKKVFLSVPYIMEKVHFNVKYPENQTMTIKNYRTKTAKVYDGTKWITVDEDEFIDKIIYTYEQILEEFAGDDPEKMKYIDNYNKMKERDTPEVILKDLKEEIKKLLYDNRDMIKIKN